MKLNMQYAVFLALFCTSYLLNKYSANNVVAITATAKYYYITNYMLSWFIKPFAHQNIMNTLKMLKLILIALNSIWFFQTANNLCDNANAQLTLIIQTLKFLWNWIWNILLCFLSYSTYPTKPTSAISFKSRWTVLLWPLQGRKFVAKEPPRPPRAAKNFSPAALSSPENKFVSEKTQSPAVVQLWFSI